MSVLKKSFDDAYTELKKAGKKGEGSRGGKVIGHTKSGKPIYDIHNHPSHKKFNAKDHLNAYYIQTDIANNEKSLKVANKYHDEADKHWESLEKKNPKLAAKLMEET